MIEICCELFCVCMISIRCRYQPSASTETYNPTSNATGVVSRDFKHLRCDVCVAITVIDNDNKLEYIGEPNGPHT